jgi:hypothetical protein
MLDPNKIKEFLSLLKDKTVQTALVAMAIAIFSFMGGRVSVPNCDIDGVCQDLTKDKKKLSKQLTEARQECRKKKDKALADLRVELNAICAGKISDASEGSEFDPDVHCAICIARGECKEND